MRTTREIWEYTRDLERLEGARRCTDCGAREDRHNLLADMEFYGYGPHEFRYPRAEEIAGWKRAEYEERCARSDGERMQ